MYKSISTSPHQYQHHYQNPPAKQHSTSPNPQPSPNSHTTDPAPTPAPSDPPSWDSPPRSNPSQADRTCLPCGGVRACRPEGGRCGCGCGYWLSLIHI